MFKRLTKNLLPRISGKLNQNRIIFRQKRTADINRLQNPQPTYMTFTVMWDEAMTNYSLKNTTPINNISAVKTYTRLYR